jgi:hypothetical protein
MVASLGIFQYIKNRYYELSPTTKKIAKYILYTSAIFLGVIWLIWNLFEIILELLGMLARNIFVVLFVILLIVLFVNNL